MFSNRYLKNDDYLNIDHPLEVFAVVRDPMYKYSRFAQNDFFKRPSLAFLFLWYANSPKAINFTFEKYNTNPDPSYFQKMIEQIAYLAHEAYKYLQLASSATESDVSHSDKEYAQTLQSYLFSKHMESFTPKRDETSSKQLHPPFQINSTDTTVTLVTTQNNLYQASLS